jgi:hypothetical protein
MEFTDYWYGIWLARLVSTLTVWALSWWKKIEASEVFAHHWLQVVTAPLHEIGKLTVQLWLVLL